MYPYFEGTEKTFDPYSKKENAETYESSQRQRYYERNIRKAKRELMVAEAINDPATIAGAKKKVSDRQARMRAFIDESGRTRRRDREQIY
jgi:hypothetical protein